MNKHTPGPWTVVNWGTKSKIIHGLLCIATTGNQQTSSETDADARLIAAAPELLEALHRVVGELVYMDEKLPYSNANAALDIVRAAIAKAEGK